MKVAITLRVMSVEAQWIVYFEAAYITRSVMATFIHKLSVLPHPHYLREADVVEGI